MRRIKKFSEELDFHMFKHLFGDIDNCSFDECLDGGDDLSYNTSVLVQGYPRFCCIIDIPTYDVNTFTTPKGVYGTSTKMDDDSMYQSLLSEVDESIDTFKSEIKNYQKAISGNEKIKEILDELREVVLPRVKEYSNFKTMYVSINDEIVVYIFMKMKTKEK